MPRVDARVTGGRGESVSCAIASTDAVATGGAMDEAAKHSEELIHTYSEDEYS
jgi:hypothetical protein